MKSNESQTTNASHELADALIYESRDGIDGRTIIGEAIRDVEFWRKRLVEFGWSDSVQGLHPIGTKKRKDCTCINCRNQ